jgi:hypothetical protein
MSDEQTVNADSNRQAESSYEQGFVEELEKYWQDIYNLSPRDLRQVLLALPNKYKTMAIQAVTEYLANSMKVHLLHTAAIFCQQAEDEGVDAKERAATLEDVEADVCSIMELSQSLSVRTYKDLLKLGKIAASVQGLGESDTAEDAQNWLYNMPAIYSGRLKREHLIKPVSEKERWLQNLSTKYQGTLEQIRSTDQGFDLVVKLPTGSIAVQVKTSLSSTISGIASFGKNTDQRRADQDEIEQWGKVLPFPQQRPTPMNKSSTAG